LFEEASGGTLFLDEIEALNLSGQAKLLRVLQERQVRRVGGRENISLNVRLISASNHDLQHAVTAGTFRADLLFRLRVMPLQVPGLHERAKKRSIC
jgi:transcriptional regulator with PAS, ATPase and Fis domain